MINTIPQFEAMLGKWRDRGFSLREAADPVDENDSLIVLYFHGEKVGTYYRSKLTLSNIPVVQMHCENFFNNRLRHITEGMGK